MLAAQLSTPHCSRGRQGQGPGGVVLHTTAGSFDGAAAWFADPSSGVSAHYLVGLDGHVAKLVDEADTAFHAGRVRRPTSSLASLGDPNVSTIGIEFEDGGDAEGVHRPDAQYRAGARLLAQVAARWEIPLDREHVIGHRELFAAKACPGNLDIDRLLAGARAAPTAPFVVGLLPARNAAALLAEYLERAGEWCDALVALDDGSTDATAEILAAHPIVTTVLRNPVRESVEGWDDGANRNRLLTAAADLAPDWILSVDADEQIPADDARALRGFLAGDALPQCAYGLRIYRMHGDRCDPDYRHVYRLFAWRPNLEFPQRRLHFSPVPTAVPAARWVATSVRMQHLDAARPGAGADRRDKYARAYPGGEHSDLPGLTDEAADLVPWVDGRPDLGVLEAAEPVGAVP